MEQHEVTAKKIWSIARVLFFMMRKGISKKSKLLLDLNMMIKRGKIAGKALHNLIFNQHHKTNVQMMSFATRPGEYEFSCSNSPAYPISLLPTSFTLHKNRKQNVNDVNNGDDEEIAAVIKALEMLQSGAASPALPGFLKSPPMVRQLRITDSPFPLSDLEMGDSHVDEAAEEFIIKFYKQLKKQNL